MKEKKNYSLEAENFLMAQMVEALRAIKEFYTQRHDERIGFDLNCKVVKRNIVAFRKLQWMALELKLPYAVTLARELV